VIARSDLRPVILPSEFGALEDLNAFPKVNNYPPFKTRYDYISYAHRQPSFDPSEILVFAPRGEGTVDPAEEAFGEAPA
jgi:hypothetical protein